MILHINSCKWVQNFVSMGSDKGQRAFITLALYYENHSFGCIVSPSKPSNCLMNDPHCYYLSATFSLESTRNEVSLWTAFSRTCLVLLLAALQVARKIIFEITKAVWKITVRKNHVFYVIIWNWYLFLSFFMCSCIRIINVNHALIFFKKEERVLPHYKFKWK